MRAIGQLVAPPNDNVEVMKARIAALSRLIPMMYFILLANAWLLTFSFAGRAPEWLTHYAVGLLTLVCGLRLIVWLRLRGSTLTAERAQRKFRLTIVASGVISLLFMVWALALFPYGNALSQSHIVFFLGLSLVGTMMCLIHLRAAAFVVAGTVGPSFIIFFAMTDNLSFIAMAVNLLLFLFAAGVIVWFQSRDFTRMVNAQLAAEQREREQRRLLHMIDDMPVAVMTVDLDTWKINYLNETSTRTFKKIEHLLPMPADELLGADIDVFHHDADRVRTILQSPERLPYQTQIALGPEVLEVQISAIYADDGSFMGPMLSWAIVTEAVEAERHISHLALHDTLTGLANRNALEGHLTDQFEADEPRVGFLFVDLDGFKLINDSKGHRVGDAILQQVAERLEAACGEGIMAARLGGDEFAVVVPHDDIVPIQALADRIVADLGEPYPLPDGQFLRIGASVGIALAPLHAQEPEALLARADMALYAAKEGGRRTTRLFSPAMEAELQARVRLESELRSALENKQDLFVFYQPIFDIETGAVTAREALVRWHHPQRGWISPCQFVPVAEKAGLIEDLGRFVLRAACRCAVQWPDEARVAVNISAGQFGRGRLQRDVLEALVESGLPPRRLEVEVTETALISNKDSFVSDLTRLREIGVRVALDDFGTGYSSLAHLRAFPFDKIKIDGSFVQGAVDRPDCAAVVKAVADIGRRLGIAIVAEGIETQAQYDRVRAEGCDEAQGYLLGMPQPSDYDALAVSQFDEHLRRARG